MPSVPDNHDAHHYAERIRERLPRRLQEFREAARLSMYALWQKCGVSREPANTHWQKFTNAAHLLLMFVMG